MPSSLHPAHFLFGASLAFLAGIFAAGTGWPPFSVLATVLGATLITIAAKPGFWRACAFFFAVFLAGTLYFHAYYAAKAARTNLPLNRPLAFSAVITDEPQPTERSIMLTVAAQPPLRGAVVLFAPRDADLDYGDLVNVSGVVSAPDIPGGAPVMFSPKTTLVSAGHGFFLRAWMIRLKSALLARFEEALPSDEAALLGGITLGSRASFPPELKDAMAVSGTTHLVAVSGYNVTIVVVAAGALFGRFFSRRATFSAAAVLLLLFILMVGTQASAVRAAVMGFIALVGRELGEVSSMRNLVSFTAAAMAIVDPSAPTANIGFILSFVSLLGIVYLGPAFRNLLCGARDAEERTLFGWKESASMTFAAQFAVMPVLIRTFGNFSLTAVIANVLILATVPLTMFLGALLGALGLILRSLVFFAAKLVGLLLGYQLSVIRLFAALAVPLPIGFNSMFFMAFYYAALLVFAFSRGGARNGAAQ